MPVDNAAVTVVWPCTADCSAAALLARAAVTVTRDCAEAASGMPVVNTAETVTWAAGVAARRTWVVSAAATVVTAAGAAASGICVVSAAVTVTCPLAEAAARICVLSAGVTVPTLATLACSAAAPPEPATGSTMSRENQPRCVNFSPPAPEYIQRMTPLRMRCFFSLVSATSLRTYCVAWPPQPSGDVQTSKSNERTPVETENVPSLATKTWPPCVE